MFTTLLRKPRKRWIIVWAICDLLDWRTHSWEGHVCTHLLHRCPWSPLLQCRYVLFLGTGGSLFSTWRSNFFRPVWLVTSILLSVPLRKQQWNAPQYNTRVILQETIHWLTSSRNSCEFLDELFYCSVTRKKRSARLAVPLWCNPLSRFVIIIFTVFCSRFCILLSRLFCIFFLFVCLSITIVAWCIGEGSSWGSKGLPCWRRRNWRVWDGALSPVNPTWRTGDAWGRWWRWRWCWVR